MNILRSRYRGVIHFYPAEADSRPEIEFLDGEGPEQVMNQIQDVAVPEIRKNIEPLGPFLRWEELDLETGTLRRHRSPFHDRFEFVIGPDETSIQLILPADAGTPAGESRARPWVPLRPLAEPEGDQLAAIGWSVAEPEFKWRYLQTRYAPPTVEMSWSCASLPGPWAARVLAQVGHLDCVFGDGERCSMNPTRDGLLVFRGFYPLPPGSARPARLPVRLEQPLLVVGPESSPEAVGTSDPGHVLEEEVAATVEALDVRAMIDGRATRLVARADLARRFEAEVMTDEDALLPDLIPAGAIPGLPWPLAVAAAGFDDGDDAGVAAGEAETGGRRWRLTPRLRGGDEPDLERGRWRDVSWQGEPPSLTFGLGSFDAQQAPRITHIENRRANVAWRVEASDEGHRLCLCVPHWVPVGCPGQVALPPRDAPSGASAESNGFDYGAEVRARLDGLEERFVIDQSSELPGNRLFLGPRRWRFRDQRGSQAIDAEALGEGAGCVRWRRPAGDGAAGRRELTPTDWAGGSAPVLLLTKDRDRPLDWGGLYAPRKVPWDALEEVHAEPTPDPEEVLLVPRPPSPDMASAIWIDLWGFVCRYDLHRTVFTRSRGKPARPTLWIARTGLELFPRRGGYLLRSFAPLYAVRDPEPRVFSLRAAAARPTLHVGHELDAAAASSSRRAGAPLVLEIGAETFVRHQLTDAGEVPSSFESGRVPGTRLRLDRVGVRTVWLAVEQRRGDEGRRAGYVLSWSAAAGWLFRGFFAHEGAAVELGETRRGERRQRVFLGGAGTSRVSTFRLTLDRQGTAWSDAPDAVSARTTPEMLDAWENDHFAPERRPPPLQGYGTRILQQAQADQPWIFEFFDRSSQAGAGLPPGLRVWEMHAAADDELADARELGEDLTEEAAPPAPRAPEKRILRADDDDGF